MTTIRQTHQWAGGEVWEAADLISGVNLPLNDLIGRNGQRDLENALLVIPGADGDRFFDVPAGTTAQRPTSPEVGYVRFNTTTEALEWWTGSRWADPDDATVVTFENLNNNGQVGDGAGQVAVGDHVH